MVQLVTVGRFVLIDLIQSGQTAVQVFDQSLFQRRLHFATLRLKQLAHQSGAFAETGLKLGRRLDVLVDRNISPLLLLVKLLDVGDGQFQDVGLLQFSRPRSLSKFKHESRPLIVAALSRVTDVHQTAREKNIGQPSFQHPLTRITLHVRPMRFKTRITYFPRCI